MNSQFIMTLNIADNLCFHESPNNNLYRIAGNFHGVLIFVILWSIQQSRKFSPMHQNQWLSSVHTHKCYQKGAMVGVADRRLPATLSTSWWLAWLQRPSIRFDCSKHPYWSKWSEACHHWPGEKRGLYLSFTPTEKMWIIQYSMRSVNGIQRLCNDLADSQQKTYISIYH